jgi:hypothetical protein
MKKLLAVGALALGLMNTSCIGSNQAFNGIHDWNEGVSENKWAQEAVHLGFWILPVYNFALLGDIVIFNSVEFWTGENPLAD